MKSTLSYCFVFLALLIPLLALAPDAAADCLPSGECVQYEIEEPSGGGGGGSGGGCVVITIITTYSDGTVTEQVIVECS